MRKLPIPLVGCPTYLERYPMVRTVLAMTLLFVASAILAPKADAGLFDCLRKNSCCEPAPVCCEPEPVCCEPAPAPVCCEPAPAPVCCPEPAPVCCEPAPVCCEPEPCCEPAPRCGLFAKLRARFASRRSSCCEPEPCCY